MLGYIHFVGGEEIPGISDFCFYFFGGCEIPSQFVCGFLVVHSPAKKDPYELTQGMYKGMGKRPTNPP